MSIQVTGLLLGIWQPLIWMTLKQWCPQVRSLCISAAMCIASLRYDSLSEIDVCASLSLIASNHFFSSHLLR